MKINAEKGEGPELAEKFGIRGFPTIVFSNNQGQEIDRIVGYMKPEPFLKQLKRINSGKNTLPALLMNFQLEPENFNTMFSLVKKYEAMDDAISAKRMIEAIIGAGVDSASTAEFFLTLYNAREKNDPQRLINYANQNPESSNVVTALQEAMYFVRRSGNDSKLEADLFLRIVNLDEDFSASMMNSFAWRMSELELYLEDALEKVSLAIDQTKDNDQKFMYIDTKSEVLWKLGRTEDALIEINKCIVGKPNDEYFQEQKEKFNNSLEN